MSAEARVQSGSLRWAQPRRYLSQPRQQGRVSAEARVQSGSLRWAQPRRWPLYPWAGSRMTEIPGPTRRAPGRSKYGSESAQSNAPRTATLQLFVHTNLNRGQDTLFVRTIRFV